ncbi:MAG: hypothetical protein EBR02_01235 [Alphaproteobacteria bacterium]|nr:hypothetical protein [Alphaproteobacteria bacterium]
MGADDSDFMQNLPHYRMKYNAEKKIHVYFVPAHDTAKNEKMYFYVVASEMLHDETMRCLKHGDIPYFAVVVEKGYGQPDATVKDKIKAYYGFDHDACESA